MAEFKIFIREAVSIDRSATSSILVGEVTSLDHEVFDDTVENGALIPFSFR